MTKTLLILRYHWKDVLGWGLAAGLLSAREEAFIAAEVHHHIQRRITHE